MRRGGGMVRLVRAQDQQLQPGRWIKRGAMVRLVRRSGEDGAMPGKRGGMVRLVRSGNMMRLLKKDRYRDLRIDRKSVV